MIREKQRLQLHSLDKDCVLFGDIKYVLPPIHYLPNLKIKLFEYVVIQTLSLQIQMLKVKILTLLLLS